MRVGARAGSRSAQGEPISLLPRTQLGRWAVGLAFTFVALVLVGTAVPRGGGIAVVCGLLGGVLALVAVVRDGERAVTVFATLAPLAFAVPSWLRSSSAQPASRRAESPHAVP